jgi:hypothetical protein
MLKTKLNSIWAARDIKSSSSTHYNLPQQATGGFP